MTPPPLPDLCPGEQDGRPYSYEVKNNVLAVGHDKETLDDLCSSLNDSCDLFVCGSERTLFKALESHSIQLIIINTGLENGDGARWCTRLKSSPHYSYIPVILLIDKDTLACRTKSLEFGADGCIGRPLCTEYLKAQVKNLLVNRSKIKDYFAHSLFAHMSSTTDAQRNEAFMGKLNDHISGNLSNSDLDVDFLARLLNMSRPTLYRKIKTISDLTPNELINVARLNRAAGLISANDDKISDIAKKVGYNSRSNFGKAFLKQFRLTPRQYQQVKKRVYEPPPLNERWQLLKHR